MSKKQLFFILLFTSTISFCQVINIESLRKPTDSSHFMGTVKLDIDLTKNVNTFFDLTNEIILQYTSGKSLFFFVNNIDLTEVNKERLTNKRVQHLRYNYKLKPRLTLEAFTQFQKDKVSFINFRTLVGLGARFHLFHSKKNKFFLGTLMMYEYENSIGNTDDIIEKTMRGDVYFSFNMMLKENIFLSSTTYYQPKLNYLSDYRISSETSFSFTIFKKLALTTSFSYQFDKFPVLGIPNSQYKLENGIQYTF